MAMSLFGPNYNSSVSTHHGFPTGSHLISLLQADAHIDPAADMTSPETISTSTNNISHFTQNFASSYPQEYEHLGIQRTRHDDDFNGIAEDYENNENGDSVGIASTNGSMDSDTDILEEDQSPSLCGESTESDRYEFRQNVRARAPAFGGTWVDRDDTGNYNPIKENRHFLRNSFKRKRTHANIHRDPIEKDSAEGRRHLKQTLQSGRQNGRCLNICLKLHSPEGKSLLKKGHDNILAEHWNIFTDSDFDLATTSSTTHRLRNRQEPRDDDEDDSLDLTGHPAARGCKACRTIGQRCSMLDPEQIYPCFLCATDNCDCELVVQPTKKRACELCKKRKLRCSYLDSDYHDSPCYACGQHGYKCVAGPHIEATRTRLTAEGKPGTIHEPPPRPKRVKRTKDKEKELELQGETSESCPETRDTAPQSVKAPVPSPRNKINRTASSLPTRHEGQHSTQQQAVETQPGIETIHTKLVHPIKFNYVDKTRRKPCHWCHDPIYGLLGVGQTRSVRVMQLPNGQGCTEIGPSSVDAVGESSRCCRDCTFSRVRIVACRGHTMRQISKHLVPPAWEAAFNLLMTSQSSLRKKDLIKRFCSICPSLAHFECRTNPTTPPSSGGCGLRLCRQCNHHLATECGGDLNRMVETMVPNQALWPMGLRADYEFFKSNGYLVKQVSGG